MTPTPIADLYRNRDPTGIPILDQVTSALRQSRIIKGDDLATLLNVDPRELRAAWHLLTGTTLTAAIIQWRVLQALDLLEQAGYPWTPTDPYCKTPPTILQQIAERCGWRSATVLKHVLYRQRKQQLSRAT